MLIAKLRGRLIYNFTDVNATPGRPIASSSTKAKDTMHAVDRLRSGESLVCEAKSDHSERRRFGYILHNVNEHQTAGAESSERLFIVGTFEIPIAVLGAEARGQVMDQVDHQYEEIQRPTRGADEALSVLETLLAGRAFIQPLQDERSFEPPILL
ncbi:MAG: hypothetical protein AAFQ65_01505 [Myxococcota bacterium]